MSSWRHHGIEKNSESLSENQFALDDENKINALDKINNTVIEADDKQDADEQFQKIIENTPGCSYFPFFNVTSTKENA